MGGVVAEVAETGDGQERVGLGDRQGVVVAGRAGDGLLLFGVIYTLPTDDDLDAAINRLTLDR
ncbi:hypothetical protein Asi03nite_60160 [Actinoplanes siamensis]|uniref:Uncharacterized protein n=1 Tax=Actinoplanes siamensis TaxID=1223317 RepID=A0A919NCM7_9ACTN|nr:hypothetical protein Asi03nite_60160 [Actinoplanes siamensis]